MKKLLTLLLLLPFAVFGQTTYQLNYDSIRVNKTAGTGGTSLYGKVYLKNVGLGLVSDSILTVLNGRIRKVPVAGIVPTLGTSAISLGGTANGLSYLSGNYRLHKVTATTGGVLTTGTDTIAGNKRFTNSGSDNTVNIDHTSGAGIGLTITKGGNGEGLIVNKTSGSGNAVTVTGGVTALENVIAQPISGTAIQAITTTSNAIQVTSTTGNGVEASSTTGSAISGNASGILGSGVTGQASNTGGAGGNFTGSSNATYAVLAQGTGSTTTALYGTANSGSFPVQRLVQFGAGAIASFDNTGGNVATISNTGSISSTPQGTLYGTASGSITSSQLATSLTDETGTGSAVFSASPTLTGEVTVSSATIPFKLNRSSAGGALFPLQIAGVDKSFIEWNVNDGGSGAGTAMNLRNEQGAVGLYDSTNTGLKISSGSGVFAGSSTAAAFIPSGSSVPTNGMYLSAANTLDFATNSTNRLSISSAGASTFTKNVTVKSGNGDQLLLDNAGERFTQMDYFNNGSGKAVTYWDNTNNWFQIITTPASSTIRAVAGTNGVELANGGTSWSAISDLRQKEIIRPIDSALLTMQDFRTVIGRYKTDDKEVERPFLIAQDVQKTYPFAVTVSNDEDKTLRLSYTELIPLLVKAIQELEAKVKVLESK
jgi:hypothetical protein